MIGLRHHFGYKVGSPNACHSLALACRVMGRDKVIQCMKEITDRSRNQSMIRDMQWLTYVPQATLDDFNTPQLYSNTHILRSLYYNGVTPNKHNLINIYHIVQYDWLLNALEQHPEDKEYIEKYHAEQTQQAASIEPEHKSSDINNDEEKDESDEDDDCSDTDYEPSESEDEADIDSDITEDDESVNDLDIRNVSAPVAPVNSLVVKANVAVLLESIDTVLENTAVSEDELNATYQAIFDVQKQLYKKECVIREKIRTQKRSKKIQEACDLATKVLKNNTIDEEGKINLINNLVKTLHKVIAK